MTLPTPKRSLFRYSLLGILPHTLFPTPRGSSESVMGPDDRRVALSGPEEEEVGRDGEVDILETRVFV